MNSTKTYGVFVGVNEYKDLINLTYAAKDATDMAEVLRASANPSQIKLLTNSAATKSAVLDKLTWLSRKAGPSDTAIVYFSGHGGRRSSPDDHAYLCPADALAEDLEGTGITSVELTKALRAIKSERLIVLLDACYSGGLGEARYKGAGLDAGLSSQDVSSLIEGRGRVILAASRPEERAFEMREEKNSLFTIYLLRALRGEVARPDGTIWVSQVFTYVSRLMSGHKLQHAYQKSEGEDFVMLVQRNPVRPQQQTAAVVPPEIDQRPLRKFMLSAYNRAEIQVLCQDLGLRFDDLSDHKPLETQIMELIDYLHSRNRYEELAERVRSDRPHYALS
jgi:hypothetical protein